MLAILVLHITSLGIALHFTNMPLKKTIICPYFGTQYNDNQLPLQVCM
jgi:hypothetical protein